MNTCSLVEIELKTTMTKLPDWKVLAESSLAGELIDRPLAQAVLNAPDEVLLEQLAAAYKVRRHYWDNKVRLHFLT